MIIGGYTLSLYCDNLGDRDHFLVAQDVHEGVAEYPGQDRADCIRQARAAGWWLSWKRRVAICPACMNGLT